MAKARILVVDDDHDGRLLLSTLVARAGFEVDAVADGEMALATVHSHPPDLVLLEAHLPRCDGFQVCRSIKSDPHISHTPVIMLTAFAEGNARECCLDAGADEFVPKPFSADALLDTIRQLLEIRATAVQLDPGEEAVVNGMRKRPRMA